jgi:C-terminal processing protease CtpA/Prc
VPNLPFTAKNTPKFKRCTVIAISNFKGFGFTINSQVKPKYMIHDVDKNSPAEFAGLRQNDVIIEINNKNIRRTSFEKVRMMLSDAYIVGKVEVLVISKEGYTWFKQKKKRFSNSSKLTKENNVEVFSNEFQTATTTATEQINSGSRISITNLNQTITSPFSTVNENVLSSIEQQENREIFTTILRRREDYQGFGISLATNKNAAKEEKLNFPVITNVESSSPGESADLKKNDFILEINNQSTYKQSSESIANLIRNSGNEVKMVVSRERAPKPTSDVNIDEQQSLELAQSAIAAASLVAITSQKNQPLQKDSEGEKTPEIIVRRVSRASMNDNKSKRSRSESPNIISSAVTLSSSKIYTDSPSVIRARNLSEPPSPSTLPSDAPVPRLCRIRTYEPNLGFVVAGSKTKSGIFKICDIKENSPAFNSGLRNEDYIIEVSGIAVEKLKYEEIVNLIKTKQAEDDLQLLVADRKTLEWYKSRDTEISSRFVPKLTYIETLLQEELQFNLTEQLTNTTSRLSQESLTALESKFPFFLNLI